MLLDPIQVHTQVSSVIEYSNSVLFNGKIYNINPEVATPYFSLPLEQPYIPATIFTVTANHIVCNLKQPLRSKYMIRSINSKISFLLEFTQ